MLDKAKLYLQSKLNLFDQAWSNKPYDFYLLFGNVNEKQSPWLASIWHARIEPLFNQIIEHCKHQQETGIRVLKEELKRQTIPAKKKSFIDDTRIKLGRLRWNAKSHEKWTILDDDQQHFSRFELWTPIWTVCDKKQIAPELFISIDNEQNINKNRDIQFGYFMVIAVAKELKLDANSIIKKLAQQLEVRICMLKTRKWGSADLQRNWTFPNGIQNTFSVGIYKERNLHGLDFNTLTFEPTWEIIHEEKSQDY